MRRRDVIALLGGAATVPLVRAPAARAQQGERVRRLAYVVGGPEHDEEEKMRYAAFRGGLEKLGWNEGRNLRFDVHWAVAGMDRARIAAAEIVKSGPDAIMSQGSTISEALLRETRLIPIVFVGATDPQSSGLVTSMAHPGGNFTGFTNFEFAMGGKWLETLKEVAPEVSRVAVILADGNLGNLGLLKSLDVAAKVFRVAVVPVAVSPPGAGEIARAVEDFVREPNGGLVVMPGSIGRVNLELILALAKRHRLPAMYSHRVFVTEGGLMSYDTEIADLYRRAATYIDRVLRGEKPGDLPVQVPTKYELVINLKVAKALGLTVPLPLLARADEVIE